jgi:hypothetical protein
MELILIGLLFIPIVWTYNGSGMGSFSFPKGLFVKLLLLSLGLSVLLSLVANVRLERAAPEATRPPYAPSYQYQRF